MKKSAKRSTSPVQTIPGTLRSGIAVAAVLAVAAGPTSPSFAAGSTGSSNANAASDLQSVTPLAGQVPDGFGTLTAENTPLSGSASGRTGPQQAPPAVAGSGTGGSGAVAAPPAGKPAFPQNPYAAADALKLRGWDIPLPPAFDTIDQGLFGLRNQLAADGISWFGFTDDTFEDNIIRHGLPAGNGVVSIDRKANQTYSGQLPTYTTADTLFLMYDLKRYGIPDGQIVAAGSLLETNWQPGDPNGIGIGQLSYYQTLFHKFIEFKIGYLTENLEFLGTEVGGSIGTGLFGVSAAIPFETGLSLGSFTTPAINIQFNLPDHIYSKVGIQRSTDPDGLPLERRENKTNVRFTVPNASVMVIDETGYKTDAAPGLLSTWIRGAGLYNGSRYTELTSTEGGFAPGIRHTANYGLFLLGDKQVLQTNPTPFTAFQGLYVGASAMYSPPYFNAFTQYYEARVYGFGLIPGRPFDLASVVYNRNVFSGQVIDQLKRFGLKTHNNANTITGSYGFHVIHGVDLSLGLSYTDNPSPLVYTSNTGSALNFLTNLFVWF